MKCILHILNEFKSINNQTSNEKHWKKWTALYQTKKRLSFKDIYWFSWASQIFLDNNSLVILRMQTFTFILQKSVKKYLSYYHLWPIDTLQMAYFSPTYGELASCLYISHNLNNICACHLAFKPHFQTSAAQKITHPTVCFIAHQPFIATIVSCHLSWVSTSDLCLLKEQQNPTNFSNCKCPKTNIMEHLP